MHYIFLETWNWPNTWKSLSVDDWSKYIRLAVSSDFFFQFCTKRSFDVHKSHFYQTISSKAPCVSIPLQRLSLFKKKLNKQLSTNYDAHNNRLTTLLQLLQFCRSTHHFHIHYGQVKAHQKMQNIFSRSFAYRKLALSFKCKWNFAPAFVARKPKQFANDGFVLDASPESRYVLFGLNGI